MVQNISMQNSNQIGSINRIALTQDGRVIYQVMSPDGYEAGKMSVASQDADTFERAYNDIAEAAPKLQEYAQKHSSPEEIEHKNKVAKWTVGISSALGFLIPAVMTKKLKLWKQIAITLAGTVTGFITGSVLSYKMNVPAGMAKFTKATNTISKLDIKPVVEDKQTLQFR